MEKPQSNRRVDSMDSKNSLREFEIDNRLSLPWRALAGAIHRRAQIHARSDEDTRKLNGKAKGTLLCALTGLGWPEANNKVLNDKEAFRLRDCFCDLTEVIKGSNGFPGLPFDQIDNQIEMLATILKREREMGNFAEEPVLAGEENEKPKNETKKETKKMRRKYHHLPPIGTSVWCGNILLEVVPTPIKYRRGDGTKATYRPKDRRALLCLQGRWAGAFNVAPTALAIALSSNSKCSNGWKEMVYNPLSNLLKGVVSNEAMVLLNSGDCYLFEIPKHSLAPAPKQDMVLLAEKCVVEKPRPEETVSLESYESGYNDEELVEEEPISQGSIRYPTIAIKVETVPAASVENVPEKLPEAVSVGGPVMQIKPEEVNPANLLKELRELVPLVAESQKLLPAVTRYSELQPRVSQFESLKCKFLQAIRQEQHQLLDEFQTKKLTIEMLTYKLAKLEEKAKEFES
jgi:hypothetical protein